MIRCRRSHLFVCIVDVDQCRKREQIVSSDFYESDEKPGGVHVREIFVQNWCSLKPLENVKIPRSASSTN